MRRFLLTWDTINFLCLVYLNFCHERNVEKKSKDSKLKFTVS